MSERAPLNNRFMPLDIEEGRISPGRDDDLRPLQELANITIRQGAIPIRSLITSSGENVPQGLSTTTRAALSASSAASSAAPSVQSDDAQVSPIRAGVTRQREDTPSAQTSFAERREQVNLKNNDALARDAQNKSTHADYVFGSTRPMVPINLKGGNTNRAHSVSVNAPRRQSVPDYAILQSIPVGTTLPGFEFTAPQPRRQGARPAARATAERILVADSQTTQASQFDEGRLAPQGRPRSQTASMAASTRFIPKSEPQDFFESRHRGRSQLGGRRSLTRSDAPSPSPHLARGEPQMLFDENGDAFEPGVLGPAANAPHAHFDGQEAGDGQDDVDEDMMDDIPPMHGNSPPAAQAPPPPPPPPAFVPRNTGVYRDPPMATDRERATMSQFAPELGSSTVHVRFAGKTNRNIEGVREDEIFIGLDNLFTKFDEKPGHKVVAEVMLVYDRLIKHFNDDDIIAMLNLLTDRMFLESFPDVQVEWLELYSPEEYNGPYKIRPGFYICIGMTERMAEIFSGARFILGGGLQVVVHIWRQVRSHFILAFIGFRCDDLERARGIVITRLRALALLKAIFERQVTAGFGADSVGQAFQDLEDNVVLESTMVVPHGGTVMVRQFSLYIDTRDIISAAEEANFNTAMRKLSIQHPDHGKAEHYAWNCEPCHAKNHPTGKCECWLIPGWKLVSEVKAKEEASARSQNATRGGFFPGRGRR